jgi:hypothetical protein
VETFIAQHFLDYLPPRFSFFLLQNHFLQNPQIKVGNQLRGASFKVLIQATHIIRKELLYYVVDVIRQERVVNIVDQLRIVVQSGVSLFDWDLADFFLEPAVHVKAFGDLRRWFPSAKRNIRFTFWCMVQITLNLLKLGLDLIPSCADICYRQLLNILHCLWVFCE